jgi:hypothetical protein
MDGLPTSLLGLTATDKVTGFTGCMTAFCCYLGGGSQFLLQPRADANGKVEEGRWFDQARLQVDVAVEKVAVSTIGSTL